ncbi:phosphatase PAP2 family protein [Georgenia daeguensis]|uniref:Phosphatidic acid phosphatase type 2/haloperoxidase domain-containing protein n=1 Tax=Georgenia daeguensis TaxID=908355 RepID=A0ABP8ET31_9MICO
MTRTDASAAPTRTAARRVVGLLLAALAALAVVGAWWFFVTTPSGQHVDEVAYLGSRIGRSRLDEGARTMLDVVSVPFLVLVVLAGAAVALVRRRLLLAVAVAAVVGGSNVTTQLLKYGIFSRPELGISEVDLNSLPSGHTTVAASVAGAALLVTPPRWRWLAVLLGAAYAGGTGLATMIGGWHRASDVVAALLVVAAWVLLALAVVGPGSDDSGRTAPPWSRRADALTRPFLAVVGAGAGLVGLLSMLVVSQVDGADRVEQLLAYGGASAGVVAVTCLSALAALVLSTPRRARTRG